MAILFTRLVVCLYQNGSLPIRLPFWKGRRRLRMWSFRGSYENPGSGTEQASSDVGGIRLHFRRDTACRRSRPVPCENQGVHQCAHWFTHRPPACADMIRIPPLLMSKSPGRWPGDLLMAQRVGFEPTVHFRVHLISSQGRYNHFDTAAYVRDYYHDYRMAKSQKAFHRAALRRGKTARLFCHIVIEMSVGRMMQGIIRCQTHRLAAKSIESPIDFASQRSLYRKAPEKSRGFLWALLVCSYIICNLIYI